MTEVIKKETIIFEKMINKKFKNKNVCVKKKLAEILFQDRNCIYES